MNYAKDIKVVTTALLLVALSTSVGAAQTEQGTGSMRSNTNSPIIGSTLGAKGMGRGNMSTGGSSWTAGKSSFSVESQKGGIWHLAPGGPLYGSTSSPTQSSGSAVRVTPPVNSATKSSLPSTAHLSGTSSGKRTGAGAGRSETVSKSQGDKRPKGGKRGSTMSSGKIGAASGVGLGTKPPMSTRQSEAKSSLSHLPKSGMNQNRMGTLP